MSFVFVYSTIPEVEVAQKIARCLVEEKLIACANIIPNVISVFSWENKIEQAQEVILIAKTVNSCLDNVYKRIKQMHPYSCPCIVSFNINDGEKDFLKWVASSVNLDINDPLV